MKHLPQTEILIIPHKEQDYDTCGNYGEDGCGWWMEISKMERWEYEALVAVHELVEMILTKQHKVSWNKITDFDNFNIKHPDPGTLKHAPYHKEHIFSMKIEKMLCKELGISWEKYDKSFKKLRWH